MPVENEQVMHVCEMHHVMAHPIIEISSGREKKITQFHLRRFIDTLIAGNDITT
jgi:hypothetical protein